MPHFPVLIIGPDPELQLDPFADISAIGGPLAEDWRAVFEVDVPKADFAAVAQEIVTRAEYEGQADLPRLRELLAAGSCREIFARWFGGELGPRGDWGYWDNPDAKWDCFLLGGRWQGMLRLLPGRTGACGGRSRIPDGRPADPAACDQATAGDVDWPATRQGFTPFAVLKAGEWHARVETGRSGTVTAAKAKAAWEAEVDALLKGLPPKTPVSVYDCHL